MHAAYKRWAPTGSSGDLRHHRQTIKRAVEKARAAETTSTDDVAVAHNYDPVTAIIASGWQRPTAGSRPSVSCPSSGPPATRGRPQSAPSGGEAKATWRIEPPGRRPGVWAPGDMLGVRLGGDASPVCVLRRAGLEPVRFVYFATTSEPRRPWDAAGPMHGDHRWCAEDAPTDPHGMPEGRNGGRTRRPHTGLRAVRHPLRDAPTSARVRTRPRRHRREPGRLTLKST